jgi:dinuclear metal center YbgI/SA1388 family protein
MPATIKDLLSVLEQAAPFSFQESYDNSGLQIGSPRQEVRRGLICLDVTMEVVREAMDKDCDLILSHHPLLFHPLRKISGENHVEAIVREVIKNDLAVVSVHTNLDNAFPGVNHILAEKLGMKDLRVLQARKGQLRKLVVFCPSDHAAAVRQALFAAGAGHIGDYDSCSFNMEGKGTFRAGEGTDPFVGTRGELHTEPETRIETIFPAWAQAKVLAALNDSHPYEEVAYDIYPLENVYDRAGSGLSGQLPHPLPAGEFLAMVKKVLGIPVLRHSVCTYQQMVRKVAVCGGSGAFLLEHAIAAGAGAFITSEVKYNHFFEAAGRILLVDAGHHETEQFAPELLLEILKKKMLNFALLISEVNTNPIQYT